MGAIGFTMMCIFFLKTFASAVNILQFFYGTFKRSDGDF